MLHGLEGLCQWDILLLQELEHNSGDWQRGSSQFMRHSLFSVVGDAAVLVHQRWADFVCHSVGGPKHQVVQIKMENEGHVAPRISTFVSAHLHDTSYDLDTYEGTLVTIG